MSGASTAASEVLDTSRGAPDAVSAACGALSEAPLLNLGARPDGRGAVLPKPALSAVCALCEVAFRPGDAYVAVWQRKQWGARVLLGITAHRRCYAQLAAGDVTRVFAALEAGLALPLAALRPGERVEGRS